MIRTSVMEYHNACPDGRDEGSDGTVSALANVTGMSWYEAYDLYCATGRRMTLSPLNPRVLDGVSKSLGAVAYRPLPKSQCGGREVLVGRFCDYLTDNFSSGEGVIARLDGGRVTSFRDMTFVRTDDGYSVRGYKCFDKENVTDAPVGRYWVYPPLGVCQ